MSRRREYRVGDVVGFRLTEGDEDLIAYLNRLEGRGEVSALLRRLLREHVQLETDPRPSARVRQILPWLTNILQRLASGEALVPDEAQALQEVREQISQVDAQARRNLLTRFAADDE